MIVTGNCLELLKKIPEATIDCCVTSPPYYNLRDYGVVGQIGAESTPEEYIKNLCDVFDEVKRVLKPEGSCWVNIGDTYGGYGNGFGATLETAGKHLRGGKLGHLPNPKNKIKLTPKSLLLTPERFVIEMSNRGWLVRNVIIWHKPSCMPDSTTDRYTRDFEYLYFFTKQPKYYFKQQKEPIAESSKQRAKYGMNLDATKATLNADECKNRFYGSDTRNKRAVWTIASSKFREAHFATFPEKLIESPVDATCPEFICKKCEKPREVIWKATKGIKQEDRVAYKMTKKAAPKIEEVCTGPKAEQVEQYIQDGWTDCGCNAGWCSGIVLDPFSGAGTTGVVAMRQGKKYVGLELNPEYVSIATIRLKKVEEEICLTQSNQKPSKSTSVALCSPQKPNETIQTETSVLP